MEIPFDWLDMLYVLAFSGTFVAGWLIGRSDLKRSLEDKRLREEIVHRLIANGLEGPK